MSREAAEYKRFLKQEAERERQEEERRMAPIREAEEQVIRTHRELAGVYISRLRGEVRDPEVYIAPEVTDIRLSQEDANKFITAEAVAYFRENPGLFSHELAAMIDRYFEVNGIGLPNRRMFSALVERFKQYHLLPEPAAPESEPVAEQVHVTEPAPEPQPTGPPVLIGRDYLTGRDKEFTSREIDLMPAEEYARAFPVARTFQKFFSAARQQREGL